MFDGKAFGAEMTEIVKSYVDRTVAPLLDRIKELEGREPVAVKGDPGERGPVGEKGEKGDPGAPGAPGERGDVGAPGEPGERGETGEKGDPGERGLPGERGEKGDPGAPGERGDKGEKGDAGERGPEGPAGRDGRDGLPGVPGTPGEKGMDGRDGRDGVDGKAGRDGRDGLGFDDLELSHDGERGFVLRFVQGDRVKEFPFSLPVVLDRGVYKAEAAYAKGDAVTWAGSLWIAQEDTAEKPDTGKGWRLAVKRGRDGKDAR